MRIAYITAGAAGMYCGSCMRDNTLVAELQKQGHDALLIPTYTPITTDEPDVSQKRVFFGGINVYLQQKLSLFRHTPWLFDRLLDAPRLLRWVSRFAVKTKAEELGDLTISMLQGEHGHQRKEITKLVRWLRDEIKPEIVCLTNALLSGMVHEIKRELGVPVLCTLQGDDIFLEALPEPFRGQAIRLIGDHCREIDGFIATSGYYADFMAGYLGIPRDRFRVVYPGLNLAGHGGTPLPRAKPPYVIGYFARICPEKGLHHLVEAFRILRQMPDAPPCRLHVSGWLGENNKAYFDDLQKRLHASGLGDQFQHVESPDHAGKVRFLQGLDVLSVPTVYREPKGLYILEALANGVPVVQPRHGSFPELIEMTGGGHLVNPDDPEDLARGLRRMVEEQTYREELGRKGKEAVHQRFTASIMARETTAVFGTYLSPSRAESMPEAFHTTRRVEFADTDMAGIVHFANFFIFMEAAEVAFLRARGLSVKITWEGESLGFPRVAASCDYENPARFEDVLDIAVRVQRLGRKSVTYAFEFTKDGEPIAHGQVTSCCCRIGANRDIEPIEIPASIRALLEQSV